MLGKGHGQGRPGYRRAIYSQSFGRFGLAVVIALMLTLTLEVVSPVAQAAGRSPVIVIPGVAGSTFAAARTYTYYEPNNGHGGTYQRTYNAGETVWVNVGEAIFSGSDDYFDTLRIGPDGNTPVVPYSNLAVSGLYGDGYNDLLDYLRRQGYVDNVTLFAFPYDWRRDIPTATYANLDALVDRARSAAGTSQVDLIGHSMGGLVGRNYISTSPASAAKVRRMINLGTPYLGSPKFLKALLYGDQFGPSFLGIGLNPDEIKDLVQNMGGGWQLLPSQAYHNFYTNGSSNLLAPYREDRDVDRDGRASGVLSYNALQTFLRNLGKNQNAATLAQTFHNRLDNYWPTGVRVSFINGGGMATLGQIRDYTGSCWSWFSYKPCPKTDLLNVDGDGTVPYYSATPQDAGRGLNLAGEANIHIVNREHGALVQYDRILGIYSGDGPSLTMLGQILNNNLDPVNKSSALVDLGLDAANRSNRTRPRLTGYAISATNGVQIEAVDDKGKRTGRVGEPQTHKYEQNIEGSKIDTAGGTQYIYVPEGGRYTLRLSATESGSFDLKIRMLNGDTIERTAVYLNVPAEANDQTELSFTGLRGGAPNLRQIEGRGRGKLMTPSAVLDTQASADQQAPKIELAAPRVQSNGKALVSWQARDDLAGLHLQQGVLDPETPASQLVQNGQAVQLSPGTHTLQVLALDRAGNTGIREITFNVP